MMDLADRVLTFSHEHHLWHRGDTIVVACSGGPDSLVLLDVMLSLRAREGIDVVAAHFEHGIRGDDSLADAAFVEQFCSERGVACFVRHEDVPSYARENRMSIETAARERRYAFLRKIASEQKSDGDALIAVAHQKDDQAETVMMHILRGSGIAGLCGMRPRAGDIIRPLLDVSRADIERYAEVHGLAPRHDATNDELDATRNKVRHILMPLIRREFNLAIDDALMRLSSAAGDSADFLRAAAKRAWDGVVEKDEFGFSVRREAFKKLPKAVAFELLSLIGERIGLSQRLTAVHYDDVMNLIEDGRTGARLNLPSDMVAAVDYNQIHIYNRKHNGKNEKHEAHDKARYEIASIEKGNVTVRLDDFGMMLEIEKMTSLMTDMKLDRHTIAVDVDVLPLPWTIRAREDGDAMMTSGGRKKIKKLLIDAKIPREERDSVPIFVSHGDIFWAGGVRRSSLGMIKKSDESAQSIVLLKLHRYK